MLSIFNIRKATKKYTLSWLILPRHRHLNQPKGRTLSEQKLYRLDTVILHTYTHTKMQNYAKY